jgi:S-DNA-T family DNA segregation ATPase FtsK/SpoIIIE
VFAVVLWAVTRSPFALLFAALGPVTAIASYVDSRLGGRRRRRQEDQRFAREAESVLAEVGERHARERESLDEVVPAAATIAARTGADPYRWSGDGDIVGVTLGRGVIPSGVELDRPARGTPVDAAIDDLERRASRLDDAPVIVDARLGIGVCGPPVLATALARAIGLQLAWRLSPASHWLSAEEQWAADLPHGAGRQLRRGLIIEDAAVRSIAASIS